MAFTIGSGTFTNGSATVTGVTLTSGTLAYFASGTRMVVGVNPVVQEVEAIAAPTVSTITLRSAWTGTGGTYSFLANQTSEGLRDAVQAIRANNASLQSFIDSIDTAATADSVAQRTSNGSINAVDVNATRLLTTGNAGLGTSSVSEYRLNVIAPFTSGVNGAYIEAGEFNKSLMVLNHTNASVTANLVQVQKSGSGIFTINSSGNVGIGTSSPSELLSIFKTSYPIFKIESTSYSGTLGIDTGNGNLVLANISNAGLLFNTNSTERMRIDSNGNLLVGTTSFVYENANSFIYSKSDKWVKIDHDSASGSGTPYILFGFNGSGSGSITQGAGLTVAYNTSSDYRLKEDWQPMDCACDRVMQLNPVNFKWKIDGTRVDGFLAHELAEVIPEAVTGEKDETRIEEYEVEPAVYEDVVIPAEFDEEGVEISPERTEQKLVKEAVMGEREVPVYQGIDQSKVVPLLTAALQHALKDIADLKARIEALEG